MSNNLQIKVLFNTIDRLSEPLKKIDTRLKETLKNVQEQKRELKNLDKVQSQNEDELKKYTKAIDPIKEKIKEVSAKLKEERQELGRLKSAMDRTKNPSKALKNQLDKVRASVKELNHEQQEQLASLRATTIKFKDSGFSLSGYKKKQEEVKQKVEKTTHALQEQERELKRINKIKLNNEKYRTLQENLTKKSDAAKAFGMKAIAPAVGGGFFAKNFLSHGVNFEQAMSKVEALERLDRNNAKDLAKLQMLTAQAKALGASTKFTATQVADAQGYLAMAGFTVEQIKESLPSVLNAAIASGFNIDEVSDIASDIAGGFKIPAKEMGRVADVLSFTSSTANVDMRTMYETMKEAAPVMTSLGQSIETTAALTGLLGNIGIKGSSAGTALKNIGLSLASEKIQKKLKKIGISVKDAKGNLLQVPEILRKIKKKTAKMGTADRSAFLDGLFGKIPIAAAMALVDQADGVIQKYEEQEKHAQGVAQKIANIMSNNTAGDVANLSSAWEGFAINIFEEYKDEIRTSIQQLTSFIRKVSDFAKTHKELVKTIGKGIIVAGSFLAVVGALSMAYSFTISPLLKFLVFSNKILHVIPTLGWMLGVLRTGIVKLIPIIRGLNLSMLANPMFWIPVAIIGLTVLYFKCKWFRDKVDKIFSFIKASILAFWQSIKNVANNPGNFKAWVDLLAYISPVAKAIQLLMDNWVKLKRLFGFGDEKTVKLKQITENETIQKAGALQTRTAIASALNAPQVTIDRKAPIKAKGATQTINAPMTATININGSHLTHEQLQHAVHQAMQQAHNEHQAKLRASLVDQY